MGQGSDQAPAEMQSFPVSVLSLPGAPLWKDSKALMAMVDDEQHRAMACFAKVVRGYFSSGAVAKVASTYG